MNISLTLNRSKFKATPAVVPFFEWPTSSSSTVNMKELQVHDKDVDDAARLHRRSPATSDRGRSIETNMGTSKTLRRGADKEASLALEAPKDSRVHRWYTFLPPSGQNRYPGGIRSLSWRFRVTSPFVMHGPGRLAASQVARVKTEITEITGKRELFGRIAPLEDGNPVILDATSPLLTNSSDLSIAIAMCSDKACVAPAENLRWSPIARQLREMAIAIHRTMSRFDCFCLWRTCWTCGRY